MTKYKINFCSKDKKSLNSFLDFSKCNNIISKNFQLFFKLFRNKKIKKNITILKSPHVNKTAQEQFGYTIYSITMSCYSWEVNKYLVVLKKIKNYLFPSIKIQINAVFLRKNKYFRELLFNPMIIIFYNYSWVFLKQKKSNFEIKNLLKKSLFYLNVLSCYGEFK